MQRIIEGSDEGVLSGSIHRLYLDLNRLEGVGSNTLRWSHFRQIPGAGTYGDPSFSSPLLHAHANHKLDHNFNTAFRHDDLNLDGWRNNGVTVAGSPSPVSTVAF